MMPSRFTDSRMSFISCVYSVSSEEELYNQFCKYVQNNLHIVFTMNPAGGDFSGRASTSPALFNRCVINWFGTWSDDALYQVAKEFVETEDLEMGPTSADGSSSIH